MLIRLIKSDIIIDGDNGVKISDCVLALSKYLRNTFS